MHIEMGRLFNVRYSPATAIAFLLVTVALVTANDGSYDDQTETAAAGATQSDDAATIDFQRLLWHLYLLPRLEANLLENDIGVADSSDSNGEPKMDGLSMFQTSQWPRLIQRSRIKRTRGIAGLDNMDILLKTMDLNRGRSRPMLSVSGMNTDRLRNLMSLQGRRRK